MPNFVIFSTHPDFKGKIHSLTLTKQELNQVIQKHKDYFLALYGTDPHAKRLEEEGDTDWVKGYGITRQDNLPYNRRKNFLPKLLKIPDIRFAIVNPTVWMGKGTKEKSQELDFILLDKSGKIHIAEFMTNTTPHKIMEKLQGIHRKVVWSAVLRLVKKYLHAKKLSLGNLYFFVDSIPRLSGQFSNNIFFVKYSGHPDEADFEWRPIPFKDLK